MKHIVFDIETIAQDEAKLLALAPEFTAPGNLKDPEKIAAAIAKKRADYIADAALNWKTAEVVLIGAGDGSRIESFAAVSEKELVGHFLTLLGEALADGVVVGGHNVKGFDLPMLVNRARVHGLPVPSTVLSFWRGRPTWNEHVFDTLEVLSFGKAFDGNGVDDVARVFGLPPKLGTAGIFRCCGARIARERWPTTGVTWRSKSKSRASAGASSREGRRQKAKGRKGIL